MYNKKELRCPRCNSTQVYTRKFKSDRRCGKCGHADKPEKFERIS